MAKLGGSDIFVSLMCLLIIAIFVSSWAATRRTLRNWSSLPTSVFECPDPQTLTVNRTAKVQAIGNVVLSLFGIPVMVFVIWQRAF